MYSTDYGIRKKMSQIGTEETKLLLELKYAASPSQQLQEAQARQEKILKQGDCIFTKDLCINGKILEQMGVEKGKAMGALLSDLLDEVHRHPEKNTEEALREMVLNRGSSL